MAKLAVLALAFAALVAFATAHTTIVTTTIEEDPVFQKEKPCKQHIERKQLDQCRMFLQQPQFSQTEQPQEFLEQCCEEIRNVDESCQCKAVKQAFQQAKWEIWEEQHHSSGPFFSYQQITQQLREKVQALPNLCNLKSKQCSIDKITTSVTQEDSPSDIPIFGSQPRCSRSVIRGPIKKCQRYVSQQLSSPRTLLMSINQKQEQQKELQQCCNTIQYITKECQCLVIGEVAQRVMQQPQQQGGFSSEEKKDMVRKAVQSLSNECIYLELEQCNIPFA